MAGEGSTHGGVGDTPTLPAMRPPAKSTLKQVDYAKIANIGLRGVGVVAHHGTDVVTRNAGGHFRAELLVDMVNAYLP